MKPSFLISFLIMTLTLSAQDHVLKKYEQIFTEAGNEGKNVILVFGHKHCGWCRVLDMYHDSPEIKEILEPEYVIHKIDVMKSRSGRKLFEFYNLLGTPAWMIFNPSQELLFDGRNTKGNVVGYPLKQNEIDIYISVIRKTSKGIDDQDLEVLQAKLIELGNKKKQG